MVYNMSRAEFNYPETRKDDTIDDFHGTMVPDPYRWLETKIGPELDTWIEGQNKAVAGYIDESVRKTYADKMTKLYNYTRFELPHVKANKYFYKKNEGGLQPQSIFYFREGIDGEEQFLFDPNTLSDDGTVAVVGSSLSSDAKYMAMYISEHGSDWLEIWILDTRSKEFLEEKIKYARNFAGVQWLEDNSGFYYSAFVGRDEGAGGQKLWFHTLNTEQIKDKMVFEHPTDDELWVMGKISEDQQYLFLTMLKSTMPENLLYYRKLDSDEDFIPIIDELKYQYAVLGVDDSTAILQSNEDAKNGKIISIDLNDISKSNWKTVVPEAEFTLEYSLLSNNHIIAVYNEDVKHVVKVYSLQGDFKKNIALPSMGSAYCTGNKDDKELFVQFTNFVYPSMIFHTDLEYELTQFNKTTTDIDPSKYEIKQVFYESKDKTKLPMYMMYKKGLEITENTPTLLYGYGGFKISLTPNYMPQRIMWMESGGLYAIPNLRGGGEYGEEWHHAGILEKKQNVFDDFIAAAEWLIDNKYTNPKKLAIHGGSNGGLLTGACYLQRPDLYGATISAVGVLDMLRYHKFTIGKFWIDEYGDPANPDHFKFIMKYSPLHNVKDENYPPIFLHTADTDDRVDPAHSKKFVATLQDKGKEGPFLLRIVVKAGHGMGKPVTKIIEDISYNYAFIHSALNL